VHNADDFAKVFRRRVLLRIDSKFFIRLGGNVLARKVLLLAPDRQQKPSALFRVLGRRVRLDRIQDVLAHGQLLAIRDTAGKPPNGSELPSPNRGMQPRPSVASHSSSSGLSVGTPSFVT
jgi:hypothetical protein